MRTIAWISVLGIVLPLSAASLCAEDKKPAPPDATTAAIERLIADLASDDYKTREAASRKLAAHGEAARPLLERAVQNSESVEVRSRADQLLQRLKGAAERPLGAESEGEEPGAQPGGIPAEGEARSTLERLKEWMAEWSRGSSRHPFRGGPLSAQRRIEAPGLVLERIAPGRVRLKVTRPDPAGGKVEDVLQGSSLRDILMSNPELERHAGMQELKRRDAQSSWPGFGELFSPRMRIAPFPGPGGFTVSSSQGVSIQQDASGVTVRLTEKDENGKPVVKEYRGASIEALKKEHPELKDKLRGFSVSLRLGAPNFFWPGSRLRGPKPLPPTTPRPSPLLRAPALFGLRLAPPDEALASHLGLEPGKGALVISVVPGSQAEALGLKRHDLIVKVNGSRVSRDAAVLALRKAAAERPAGAGTDSKGRAPLSVVVLRRGDELTLTR